MRPDFMSWAEQLASPGIPSVFNLVIYSYAVVLQGNDRLGPALVCHRTRLVLAKPFRLHISISASHSTLTYT